MKSTAKALFCLGAFLSSMGCDDPLKPLELVQELRVLGARVEVEGESRRAAPRPGERVRVRWLVAAPTLSPAIGWSFAACQGAPGKSGTARCAGALFATETSAAPSPALPELSFQVPFDIDERHSSQVAVLGSICAGVQPQNEAQASQCPSGAAGTRVSLEFELLQALQPNLNPSFGEPAISFDQEPWLESEPGSGPCEHSELHQIAAGSGPHTLAVWAAADARDPVLRVSDLDPDREGLLVSHFTTHGYLDRAFSEILPNQDESSIEVSWRAPKDPPAGGLLVRFWFVLRDLRGGSDFTERALCVVP